MSRGWTLIEIMIATAIVGIALAILLPRCEITRSAVLGMQDSNAAWVERKAEFVNDLDGCRLYRYVADGYPHYFTTCPCLGEKP